MSLARKAVFLGVIVLLVLLLAAGAALGKKPTHVVIVVMDQMQPGYADKYDMENVLWLQNHGVNYKNAWVGDMASETVVSHNVMVSGLYPGHQGWSDEAFRDVDNILNLGANTIVTTGDLGYDQYVKLIAPNDYPKLGDYLHHKFPGTIVANVGEKGYQVESMAASSSDYWVRMGSKKTVDPAWGLPWTGTYRGVGGNAPSYISSNNRYKVSVGNDLSTASPSPMPNDYYGTKKDQPAWRYPEDGRYVAGPYPTNLSGDTWVADAAIDIINNEDWSGLWITFSAIDKVGHMWGGGAVDTMDNYATYSWTPDTLFAQVHMPWAAKTADDQLGRVIDALKAKNEFNDTLIVVTADHGSTYGGKGDYGDNVYDGGNTNGWYAGTWYPGTTTPSTATGPAALKPLMDTGKVEFSYQSTSIDTWLKLGSRSWGDRLSVARVMQKLPGVIATYVRWGDHYSLATTGTMTSEEKSWWQETGQHLVDTMAWKGSADVVGLLANKTVYAVYGDHGGAQKGVQRIPMAFYAKGIAHKDSTTKAQLVDIMPTIVKAMGMAQLKPMDGTARNLGL